MRRRGEYNPDAPAGLPEDDAGRRALLAALLAERFGRPLQVDDRPEAA